MALESKIRAFMNEWGVKFQQNALDVITETVAYSTGQAPEITKSFKTRVAFVNGVVRFEFLMADYWQYIEYGVDGLEKSQGSRFKFKSKSPVPQKAVEKFIETRAITLKSLKRYGRKNFDGISLKSRKKVRKSLKDLSFEEERKTLTYILGRSIKKKGIKPRPFLSKLMTDELRQELRTGIANILREEVLVSFKTPD